jgi:preprotein translocase subunit SecE
MDKVTQYIKDSYTEMKENVTWSTYDELQKSTVVVLVASLTFAVFIGLMDFAFKKLMTVLYTL